MTVLEAIKRIARFFLPKSMGSPRLQAGWPLSQVLRRSRQNRCFHPDRTLNRCVLVFLLMVAAALTAMAGPRRVLIVHSFGRDFAPLDTMSATLRTELARQSPEPVEFFEASIETARFAEPGNDRPLIDYLRTLLAGRRLDLIVTIAEPATHFWIRHRAELFPDTPLLAHADHRQTALVTSATNATIVPVYIKIPVLLENILQVLPDTTNVVMVLGASPFERYWAEQCRREFAPLTNRVTVTYVNDLPLDKIRERAAAMPPHSAILYAMLAVDAAGVPYEQDKALASLRTVANAPLFGVFESQLGFGIVGGPLLSLEEAGQQAAQTALRLLRGEKAGAINIPPPGPARLSYDWRELQRWDIIESRLPAGSAVRFRPPSLWEDHKGLIVAASTVILAQMLTIAALAAHRTRLRRSQEELRESEQRMHLAAGAANLGLWVWDVRQDDIWATEECRALLGFTPDERVPFAAFAARVHPDDRACVEQSVQRALEKHAAYEAVYRVCLPGGGIRWIGARGVAAGAGTGQATRLLGVCIDITERKLADTEIQRQRAELAHVSRVSIMGELSASMAHELNQPLTAILANAQAAQRFMTSGTADMDEFHEILKDIAYDTTRARDVIRHLRALVKRSEPDFTLLDVGDTIREVVGFLHGDIVARNVRVALELTPDLPPVHGDRIQLQQVMINLLLNAFDALNGNPVPKRLVTVATSLESPKLVRVTVRDCGVGIASDKLDTIFEPFFTTKREGMGMGLSVTRSIIESHGGRIWAENDVKGGALFHFTLPVAEPA